MAVVDLESGWNADGRESGPGADRTPPQDIVAEQSVLGAMLISKDAIAEVLEIVRGDDFYKPAHELIFDAILHLYSVGEPADAITVAEQLTKRGEIGRVGGHAYLYDLVASVAVAANAGYYAEIVRDKAILRRLVQASIKIAQLGYSAEGDVDDIVDEAQATMFQIAERRTTEDYKPLEQLIEPTMDEMELIEAQGGAMSGVPTGFVELDELTAGLHGGQMIIIAARPGMGKALALDTPLPTPTGWTTMGEVRVGDLLLDADGRPTAVVAATEVMEQRPCFRITFSDGTTVVADAQHEWHATSRAMTMVPASHGTTALPEEVPHPATVTVTTEQLAGSVEGADGRPNWAIATCTALQSPEATLPVAPYELGVRGDRISAAYLRASPAQRHELLRGLLDAHGTVAEDGTCRYVAADGGRAREVHELVSGLGWVCHTGPAVGTSVVLEFTPEQGVRDVISVEPIASVPVRCVQVDNPDHLYLATESMILTHNSTLGLDICRSAAIKHGLAACIFSLEMSQTEITMRMLSAEASVSLSHMRQGTMSSEEWDRISSKASLIASAPLYVDDSPNLTMMEIRAKARRLKQQHDLKLVVLDYLQLMSSGKKVESRQLEVSEFSRQMKLLAKELDVPVIAISQLNRNSEKRDDKKPSVSDLRESGSLEQDADVIILIHREDYYNKEDPKRAGEADLIVAKHRNGPTKTVGVSFQGHYSRFANMAHNP